MIVTRNNRQTNDLSIAVMLLHKGLRNYTIVLNNTHNNVCCDVYIGRIVTSLEGGTTLRARVVIICYIILRLLEVDLLYSHAEW